MQYYNEISIGIPAKLFIHNNNSTLFQNFENLSENVSKFNMPLPITNVIMIYHDVNWMFLCRKNPEKIMKLIQKYEN